MVVGLFESDKLIERSYILVEIFEKKKKCLLMHIKCLNLTEVMTFHRDRFAQIFSLVCFEDKLYENHCFKKCFFFVIKSLTSI